MQCRVFQRAFPPASPRERDVTNMPGGALFEIERALAKGSATKKLNALSCRQIACAVLDGAHGKHWRSNFLDIAFLACGQDQNAMS